MSASLAGWLLAWGSALALTGLACVTTAVVTQRVYRRLRRSPEPDLRSATVAAAAGFATFAGAWLVIDLVWLWRRVVSVRRRG